MVRYKQGELPPLTEERQAELKVLAEQPDDKIDYSDIPPMDETFWANAVPNPFLKSIKTQASVRIALEDLYLAEQRLVDIRSGKTQTVPLEEVMKRYGLEG
jgi:uncharacterized protein (DUF4415 family)